MKVLLWTIILLVGLSASVTSGNVLDILQELEEAGKLEGKSKEKIPIPYQKLQNEVSKGSG